MPTIVRELADHSATCYEFDISTKPVSIHLSLTRLYAGLHCHLELFNVNSFDPVVTFEKKPTPEILMEPALRALCLAAQVHLKFTGLMLFLRFTYLGIKLESDNYAYC